MRGTTIAAAAVALLASACGPGLEEAFRADGFYHPQYRYRITYAPSGTEVLMGEDWAIENIGRDRGGSLQFKSADRFATTIYFDTDGDGSFESGLDFYLYDLLFEHRRTAATAWIRTFPVDRRLADRELRVLAREYVDNVAGGSYVAVDWQRVEERRLATELIGGRSLVIARTEAYEVTFSVADVDQLQVSESSRRRIVRVILLRPPYLWESPAGRIDSSSTSGVYPCMMVAGFADHPEDFARNEGAFYDMLSRLSFLEEDGQIIGETAVSPPQTAEEGGIGGPPAATAPPTPAPAVPAPPEEPPVDPAGDEPAAQPAGDSTPAERDAPMPLDGTIRNDAPVPTEGGQ